MVRAGSSDAAPLRPSGVPGHDLGEVARHVGGAVRGPVPAGVNVTGVTLDSRRVAPGDLYAALPGARFHGGDFAADAAALGAVGVLTDPDGEARARAAGLPAVVVDDPRGVLGALSAWVYGSTPGHPLLLGVTGTNGKTTTAYLLESALRGVGRTTGLIGTIETRVGTERLPSVRTTPESPDLHALLAVMRERGVEVCAMEVSSHALALSRVDGARFDVAVFTNLSQDHLDFHPDLEHYFLAKASLFTPERCAAAVVCVDDDWGRRLAAEAAVPVTTVSTVPGGQADWRVVDVRPAGAAARTAFTLRGPDGERHHLVSPLPGLFNVANTTLAVVTLAVAGLDLADVARSVAAADQVPGRMERVRGAAATDADPGPLAVVDYAHSPDAIAAALQALRPATSGVLVVALGAGGDRDTGKRGPMGAAAARGADVVVVTDDNPRTEDPGAIRAAVLGGARAAAGPRVRVREVPDRGAAVLEAVRATRGPGDTVLIAGKGHEHGQEVAGTVHPFDDRDVLRAALDRVALERSAAGRVPR